MLTDIIYNRLFEFRRRFCEGCYFNSLSQRHHTCFDSTVDEFNYFGVIFELLDEGLITKEQYNCLSELNFHTFENGASASGLFSDKK